MSVHTVVVSDLSGEPEASTVAVGQSGDWYEIDLTDAERDELESCLEPYVSAGRFVGPTLGGKKRVVPGTTVAEREEIRAWGREHGYEFADYGRIPKKVYNAYMADQSQKAS